MASVAAAADKDKDDEEEGDDDDEQQQQLQQQEKEGQQQYERTGTREITGTRNRVISSKMVVEIQRQPRTACPRLFYIRIPRTALEPKLRYV